MKSTNKTFAKKGMAYSAAARTVKYRHIILALFAVFAVYCALSLGKVKTNGELAAFLPPSSETRRGLSAMEEEFPPFESARVMVKGVTFEQAKSIADEISRVENVVMTEFDSSDSHFKDNVALFDVSLSSRPGGQSVTRSVEQIRELVSGHENYVYAKMGNNYIDKLASEMIGVMAIAAVVIAAVLLFTSKSYFEVVVFAIVFVFAALFNMGTNHWLGEISSISNSVAVILQLALAIDYAIIFAHRYQFELTQCPESREALVVSLSKSIKEISSSALTTVSGLVALMLMQFRLGYDLGTVLAKGIVCSMLTVFLLMPCMIYVFQKPLKKTVHRSLVPDISGWGAFLAKKIPVFLIVFACALPAAVILSGKTEYAFSDSSVSEIVSSESRDAMRTIDETFHPGAEAVILVPAGEYGAQRAALQRITRLPSVVSALGLASAEFGGGYVTDRFTSAEFANLFGVSREDADLLYKGFRLENGDIRALVDDGSGFAFPLVDVAMYLFGKIDSGAVALTPEQTRMLSAYRAQLETAYTQLCGKEYDRLLISTSLPVEGEESERFVETLRSICEDEFGSGKALIVGDIAVARDLRDSYKSDSVLISVLTVVFVFLILLFTFKSPVAAAVLVFVIQGSIWINFSIPYLLGMRASFVTYMIVSAIQMGATIDYAIVMMSRYLANRKTYDKKESVKRAVNESFPTLITSGAIMAAAGFIIAYRVSDVYVGHIGHAVGRGAVISVLAVLTVLPQLILLADKAIFATTFRFRRKRRITE
ncbi:MAG: MMPL family transporter [Clostridia bacterium]|nr:MMPL family transporter [Clostridia bacterium]